MEQSGRHRPKRIGKRSKRSSSPWILALAVGMGVLLVLGGGVAALFWSGILGTKGKGAAGAIIPPGWQELSSPEGRFRVLMPGTPTRQKRKMSSPVGDVHDTAFILDTADRSIMVSYADFDAPHQKAASLDNIISQARDATLESFQGAGLMTEKAITLQGYSGREVLIDIPRQGIAYFRWYAVKRRMYVLGMIGIKSTPPEAEVSRFFDSFQLTE